MNPLLFLIFRKEVVRMKTLSVGLGAGSYDIRTGTGALSLLPQILADLGPARVAILSDETVWRLHGGRLSETLEQPVTRIILPPGEGTKSLSALAEVYRKLAESRFGRSDLLLAFGGGVVGDLCGFAAATYMRGIRYVQLPTTLLAQVDSSVGGKTAVNIPQGKNLVGAFHQPKAVLMDIGLLETLPRRELGSGLAEMFKYGAIASHTLLEELVAWNGDLAQLEPAILECCLLKKQVVEQDERDKGRRMLLNFGHTFGHGIEALGGFSAHTHGEAVAMGMVLAAQAGELLGVTAGGTAAQLERALQTQDIPTCCPYAATDLLEAMLSDKKAAGHEIQLVLLREIGEAVVYPLSFDALRELLERMVAA